MTIKGLSKRNRARRVARTGPFSKKKETRKRGKQVRKTKKRGNDIKVEGEKSDRRGVLPACLWPLSRYTFLRFPNSRRRALLPLQSSPGHRQSYAPGERSIGRLLSSSSTVALVNRTLSADQVDNIVRLIKLLYSKTILSVFLFFFNIFFTCVHS